MSRNRCRIAASPRRVFAVLADPRTYAYWVVGARKIRGADPEWPAEGSAFHHAVGIGPLQIKDKTTVEAVDRPHLLRIKAKARPLGTALVTLELRRRGRGTEVTMTETPGDPLSALMFNAVINLLIRGRNERSLERLKALAEGTMTMEDTDRPSRWDVKRTGRSATGSGR